MKRMPVTRLNDSNTSRVRCFCASVIVLMSALPCPSKP